MMKVVWLGRQVNCIIHYYIYQHIVAVHTKCMVIYSQDVSHQVFVARNIFRAISYIFQQVVCPDYYLIAKRNMGEFHL
jgi:hypothetical protein